MGRIVEGVIKAEKNETSGDRNGGRKRQE